MTADGMGAATAGASSTGVARVMDTGLIERVGGAATAARGVSAEDVGAIEPVVATSGVAGGADAGAILATGSVAGVLASGAAGATGAGLIERVTAGATAGFGLSTRVAVDAAAV